MIACRGCGARWDLFDWSDDCKRCGGGALERLCMTCDGACGQIWEKAVTDSNERGAIWRGGCGLPVEEQRALFRRMHPQGDDSRWTYHQVTTPLPNRAIPRRPRDRATPSVAQQSPPAPQLPRPDPRDITRQLIAPSRTFREIFGSAHRAIAYHRALVAQLDAVVAKWYGIHYEGTHDDPDWSKANYRFALVVADSIRGIDPATTRTSRGIFLEAVRRIEACTWGDPSEPGTVFDDVRRAFALSLGGSGP